MENNWQLFIPIGTAIILFVYIVSVFWCILEFLMYHYTEYQIKRGKRTREDLVENNIMFLASHIPLKITMNQLFISTSQIQPKVLDKVLTKYDLNELEKMIFYIKKDKKKREKKLGKKLDKKILRIIDYLPLITASGTFLSKSYLVKLFNEFKSNYHWGELLNFIIIIIYIIAISVIIKKFYNNWLDQYLNHDYLIKVIENVKKSTSK